MRMFAEIHKEPNHTLPFVLTTVGEASAQAPILRPEGLEFHQFIWVKEGSGCFTVEDEQFVLQAGEGLFVRANVPHSYEGNPFHTQWVTFLLDPKTLDYLGIPTYMRYRVPEYLERETMQLFEFACGNSTVVSRSSAGYAFVIELFSTIREERESVADRIVHFLESHYAEPLTLDDIAAEAGMDRFTFCRYYKRESGMTVMEKLKQIRIAKAKRFLKYSSDSVETVGRMCGFESASYFCKLFRESVGCPPAEYRRRCVGKPSHS